MALVVLTMRPSIEDKHTTIAIEDLNAVYRKGIGFAARLTRPLRFGEPLTVCGAAARDGRMPCWGVGKEGYHCAAIELECAV